MFILFFFFLEIKKKNMININILYCIELNIFSEITNFKWAFNLTKRLTIKK